MVEKETDTLVTNAEQHHRPGMHLADMCVICWAPWPCPTIRLASALTEARAELAKAIEKRDNWHAVVKEICAEWSETNGAVCDEACGPFGHSETCKASNIADYLKALRQERDAMQAELVALRQDANDAAVALAKAQADSERMDWLERQGCVDLSANQMGRRKWCAVHDADRELGRGADMRAAIDAARLPAPSPAPPDEWTTMDGPPNGTPDTTEKT